MGEAKVPAKVKLIVGLISGREEIFSEVKQALEEYFGAVDMESQLFPFDLTDYYEVEMGKGLQRKFYAFQSLISPDRPAEVKLVTNQLEKKFAESTDLGVSRPVNIDPGYISQAKLVLATTKNYSHRIYLKGGIYAEVTLKYERGEFRPWPWTYPDYRSGAYQDFFQRVREKYMDQLSRIS